ncbi:unnamed protein product [Ceutorhynchus assimilis]|uniref:Sepiapterin reductase n=1 Tax=Ceutorhynchus assimilis TaxID=467358 RepID=A0A9P0DZM8_9CUCU|nr:unnamed protein product [Ceutorhynchus assimilis]
MADPWPITPKKNNTKITKFEDNFAPTPKLPDHAQYLAILEAKLRKLKSDPDFLRQLQEKREACLRRLLDSDLQLSFDSLSQEEAVELIKYDQLTRSQEGLDQTKSLIISESLTVLTHIVDLSKPDKALYENMLSNIDLSGIEVAYLFHNAGHVGVLKQTTELNDLQTWQQYFDLNLFSAILLNNAFLAKILGPKLVVVNITSLVGRVPFANMSMYGTGKAARELFFKVLALEQPNVTVLNYSPGPVLTEMFNSICDKADSEDLRLQFQQMRQSSVLTTTQTVAKLLDILHKGAYKSGDTIDYFD